MSNRTGNHSKWNLGMWIIGLSGAASVGISIVWMFVLSMPVIRGGSGQFIDVWFPLAPKLMFLIGMGALLVAAIASLVKRFTRKELEN